jgi:hypothetical protein
MAQGKPHLEFFPIDMNQGWETPPGYKNGFSQKILASDLDEVSKRGSRSRLLRIGRASFLRSLSFMTIGKRCTLQKAT